MSVPTADPPTMAMRLRDLETGLRGHRTIAVRDASEAWARKGPGRCLSIRDVLKDLVRHVEVHERRLGELTAALEGSTGGVVLERNGP